MKISCLFWENWKVHNINLLVYCLQGFFFFILFKQIMTTAYIRVTGNLLLKGLVT